MSALFSVSDLRLLPQHPTLENYVGVLHHPLFPLYLWNGLKLAFKTTSVYVTDRIVILRSGVIEQVGI